MSEEKQTIYFQASYIPYPYSRNMEDIVSSLDVRSFSTDAGWSQFQRDYPDACPKCKASNGLDINRKCQYCDYDNSPKKCEKCDGSYFGESYTAPLCQHCYDKAQAKKRKANERRLAKAQKEAEERAERERLAWRAEAELNDKGEINLLLDLQDEYGDIIPIIVIII